jgi:hypothetical protein
MMTSPTKYPVTKFQNRVLSTNRIPTVLALFLKNQSYGMFTPIKVDYVGQRK